MTRPRRVLALLHEDFVPPDDVATLSPEEQFHYRTEVSVLGALRQLGHKVLVVPLADELAPLREAVKRFKPHVVFNLIEDFHGTTVYDQNVVGYLELMQVPYTGCNPRGLVIGRDKALSKKILSYHRIRAPRFAVARRGRAFRRPTALQFPLIVKPLTADASAGIAEASVVSTDSKLSERIEFVHRSHSCHAIVEQFVDGRELYVGVLGHQRLTVLPTWELFMENLRPDAPYINTSRAKWDSNFQDAHQILIGPAEGFDAAKEKEMATLAKRIFRALHLSGYARLDFRMDAGGRPFFLEANPNPDISLESEMSHAAQAAGMEYHDLIQKIVLLGLGSLQL